MPDTPFDRWLWRIVVALIVGMIFALGLWTYTLALRAATVGMPRYYSSEPFEKPLHLCMGRKERLLLPSSNRVVVD